MNDTYQALFITPSFDTPPAGEAPSFRREFTVERVSERAVLHVTALGVVEPFLNGTRVGDAVLTPGWTSYRHRLPVSAHDVTGLLVPGANVMGAVVGEGWADGRIGYTSPVQNSERCHYADRPALFLQLELRHTDGITEALGTDTAFTCATVAVLVHSLYDGETYDARLEPIGWNEPGFDDSEWSRTRPYDWDMDTLVPRTAEPIRRTEELTPVTVTTGRAGRVIVDFGQNIADRLRLTTSGEAGQAVTLRHAEILTDGALDTASLRSAKAVDRYVLHGDGPEVGEPAFTFHGFRHAEIEGPFDEVTTVVVHSDMRRTGWLETSHGLVDQLHANTVWSMRGNFVGVPTDSPRRDERLGWTGGINAFSPTAVFLHDARGVLGSRLDDLAAEQREKDCVPYVAPDVFARPPAPTALWGDVAVSLPWALDQEYGDVGILRRAYPSMTRFVEGVAGPLDPDGLWSSGYRFGDRLAPDAPADDPSKGKTGKYLVAQAYLARTTRELVHASRALGEHDDAVRFQALDTRGRAAFRREYVTPAGRPAGETATAYAMAISFDLLEPGQEARAGHRLAELVPGAGFRTATGFAGTPWVLPALTRTGHVVEAYRMLLRTGCPSFLHPVTQGATTAWERWDAIRPDGTRHPSDMTSCNHYALGAFTVWLHRTVGGLTPTEPGYRRMRIAPCPGPGLARASLRHLTDHGEIDVSWRVTGIDMTIEVTVPSGTETTVVLPLRPEALETEVPPGAHSWTCPLPPGCDPRKRFTLDTPVRILVTDDDVWDAVEQVFAEHLPHVPVSYATRSTADSTLRTALAQGSGATDSLEAGFVRALESAR
ncbi:MAG TPA: family 78 glycoside hydrolase catalytic domain [Streptomyces sp.]|uniref:alpha-L-rhamnosidase n=1 Tax=Streptomyces sp. TaxID=1931 RepID=UPI002B6C773D|nr:family 78 glycoside hydrolase catalytic domain [Streptomyces sp.]HWU08902.1 family 78 glycoside hydrolase catalytic domain [Streptomyces sp.]